MDIEEACRIMESAVEILRFEANPDAQKRIKGAMERYHTTVRLVAYVRGYAHGQETRGRWELVDDINESDLYFIVGDAATRQKAVKRVLEYIDEMIIHT